jgi:predicted dehydrogenase
MVEEILGSGKHVVVEKPFTPTADQADALIEISEKFNRKIFVFHNRRWDGDFLTIQKILEQKLLGDILEYEAHFDRFTPEPDTHQWRDRPGPGSGILFDLGPHLIDQAFQLFGYPRALFADIKSQREKSMVDDYFEIDLYYDHMKAILKAGMFVKEPGPRYTIHGTRGSFIKYGIDPQEDMLKAGKMPEGADWGKEDPAFWGYLNTVTEEGPFVGTVETEYGNYHRFYDNVYDVLVNGATQMVQAEEARNVIKIIELAFESAELGKIINFNA